MHSAKRTPRSSSAAGSGRSEEPDWPAGRQGSRASVRDGGGPIRQRQVFARLCRSAAGASARARTGSGMSCPCGPEPSRCGPWPRPSIHARTTRALQNTQTKITKEAEKLRTGDPELLSHMIREELDQAEGKPDRLLLYIDQWEELYAQAPPSSDKERADSTRGRCQSLHRLVADCNAIRAGYGGRHRACRLLRSADWPSGDQIAVADPAGPARIDAALRTGEHDRRAGEKGRTHVRSAELWCSASSMRPARTRACCRSCSTPSRKRWALRKGNTMTGDSYTRSGGVREAIRITAERTFEALSAEDQQAARQLFLRLVTPGEGQEDTRARAAMPTEPTQRKIVEQFAGPRTRLLVTGLDRAARPTVEVAHEALIRTWPRLRDMDRCQPGEAALACGGPASQGRVGAERATRGHAAACRLST